MSIVLHDDQFKIAQTLPQSTRTPFQLSMGIGVGLVMLTGAVYYWLQPQIPLLYSLSQSSQQLVTKEWIFLFPVMSLTFTLLNFNLIKRNADLEPVLISLLSWTTAVLQIILLMICARLILITW